MVPTTPDAVAISALAAFLEDLEGFEGHAEHRVLLTMVPWWNFSGAWARRDLMEAGIPLLNCEPPLGMVPSNQVVPLRSSA